MLGFVPHPNLRGLASMVKGRRRQASVKTIRKSSLSSVNRRRWRSNRLTVKKKVPPGTKTRMSFGITLQRNIDSKGEMRCAFPPYAGLFLRQICNNQTPYKATVG